MNYYLKLANHLVLTYITFIYIRDLKIENRIMKLFKLD